MTQSPHRKRCGLLLCPHTMPADCAHAGYTAPPAAKSHTGNDIAINGIVTDQADNDGNRLVQLGHAGDKKSTKKADKTMRRGGKDRATQRRAMIWLICSDKKRKGARRASTVFPFTATLRTHHTSGARLTRPKPFRTRGSYQYDPARILSFAYCRDFHVKYSNCIYAHFHHTLCV